MRQGIYSIVPILFSFFALTVHAQQIATLALTTTGKEKFAIPMQVDLDAITPIPDSALQLLEIKDGKTIHTPFQIEATGKGRILHWVLTPSQITDRVFELIQSPDRVPIPSPAMEVEENDGALHILSAGKKLLQYNFKTVYPPRGVDSVYRRSGFIHPLNTPSGHTLTRIHAPDHYHHWGLWNPWTRVRFEGETLDFWNLADRKGTVRFGGFTAIEKGNVYANLSARHEHVAFKKDGTQKTALNEIHSMRIYRMNPTDRYYILDITSQLSCASSSPVTLLEYRYGGLCIRATEYWNKNNSVLLTSQGHDRKSADGSKAQWILAQGNLQNDYGGFAMMSYPINYNHPEPLRVWPENTIANDGDVFINFSPTKDKDWLLEPGKTYLLKYRFLIFDDRLSQEDAEETWKSFAHPPTLKIQK